MAAPSTEVHGHHTGVAGSAVAMRAVLLNRLEQVGKVGCRPNLKYKGQGPSVPSSLNKLSRMLYLVEKLIELRVFVSTGYDHEGGECTHGAPFQLVLFLELLFDRVGLNLGRDRHLQGLNHLVHSEFQRKKRCCAIAAFWGAMSFCISHLERTIPGHSCATLASIR